MTRLKILLTNQSSFRRKTAMVKHRGRSHQHGLEPNKILQAFPPQSDFVGPPTPDQIIYWPPQEAISQSALGHGYSIHCTSSFSDFSQSAEVEEYCSQGANAPIAHPLTCTLQQPYYVTDQSSSRVATMSSFVPESYYIPGQNVEQRTFEMPSSNGNTSRKNRKWTWRC